MAITSNPQYSASNPFYDPNSSYGNYSGLPMWKDDQFNVGYQYAEDNEEAAWERKLSSIGRSGTSTRDNFTRGQASRAHSGFEAARTQNLELQWQDYLKGLNLEDAWNNASMSEKGLSDGQFAPRTQWQMRS